MTKHTPTPWEISQERSGDFVTGCYEINTTNKQDQPCVALTYLTAGDAKANAEYIVKCVNCHDELVEALEAVQRLDYFKEHSALANIVRQALAKAKGGV